MNSTLAYKTASMGGMLEVDCATKPSYKSTAASLSRRLLKHCLKDDVQLLCNCAFCRGYMGNEDSTILCVMCNFQYSLLSVAVN